MIRKVEKPESKRECERERERNRDRDWPGSAYTHCPRNSIDTCPCESSARVTFSNRDVLRSEVIRSGLVRPVREVDISLAA